MISISKAEHLTSFWNRGPGELGSSLLSGPVSFYSSRSLCESYLDPVSLSFLKWRMKRPVSHPEKWGGVGGGGGGVFILLVNFTFIWYSYNRSWSQIFASSIQGQSANSRKDNDLRSVIQSREDALREVEKLVKHAESLERKYNEKVRFKQFLSSYRRLCFTNTTFWASSFYDGILSFRLPEFILALAFNLNLSQIQWGRGQMQAEGCFLVMWKLLLVR